MILERVKRQNLYAKPKKQNGFVKFIMTTATKVCYPSQKFEYNFTRTDLPDFQEPHIILSNHMNRLDFCYLASKIRKKRPFNYVISIDGVMDADITKLQELIMTNFGAIIKRKFTDDRRLIRNIKYSVNTLHQDLLMYPEARYSLEGKLSTLPDSIGKMIKLFGIPVETCTMHGNYIKSPQWHKRQIKDKILIKNDIKGLLTKEDIEKMSVEEINNSIKKALDYNEYDYVKSEGITITDKKRANGLHRILYQCSNCNTEFSMHSEGTKIWCDHCHKEWEYTEIGELHSTDKKETITSVHDWFDWERENVRKQVEAGTYYFEDDVNLYALPNVRKWINIGVGHLTHDPVNGYHLTGQFEDGEIDIIRSPKEMYSCHIEYAYRKYGDCLDISTNEDTFFCNPIHYDNVLTKFHFATEEIYRYNKNKSAK